MSESRLSRLKDVLLGPLVSEKTTRSGDRENSVAFWVNLNATKEEIRQAVEHFFPTVKVKSVKTLVTARPFVTFGNRKGRAKKRKKAYVICQQGTEIDFSVFE